MDYVSLNVYDSPMVQKLIRSINFFLKFGDTLSGFRLLNRSKTPISHLRASSPLSAFAARFPFLMMFALPICSSLPLSIFWARTISWRILDLHLSYWDLAATDFSFFHLSLDWIRGLAFLSPRCFLRTRSVTIKNGKNLLPRFNDCCL